MDSYLKGRGFKSDNHDSGISTEFKSLGSLMELSKIQSNNDTSKSVEDSDVSSQVIYEEENSPLVEVVSVDGSPREIVITMLDGKILKIACDY